MYRIATLRGTSAFPWLVAAGISGLLFVLYTLITLTGVLDASTLQVEHWLLGRPVGPIDCTFYEWRHVGEAPVSLGLMVVVGAICLLSGFRRRVLLYLLMLLGMSVIVEVLGKTGVRLPLPQTLHSGMTVLMCPQFHNSPLSLHLAAATGQWGKIPPAPVVQVSWLHDVAQMPLSAMQSWEYDRSYPGGHAARWCLVFLPLAWLCWRRIRSRVLGGALALFLSLFSFLGGFMQFYIAAHTISDTIAGYLLGICLAFCAIAVLALNDTRRQSSISPHVTARSAVPEQQPHISGSLR